MLTLYKYQPCRIYNLKGHFLTQGVAIISRSTGEIKYALDHTATVRFTPVDANIEVL